MSYQVLARKWRPRTFAELVGQEHVVRPLVNALDHNRLHHAFLFTGTRGVGKTTIARILAKSLNCETGVTSKPCGQCSSCVEVDEGRFMDLIEVDAASRTKVDDTRELLDNVPYAPTRGRYKVYLIDEVHMLSGHSFNALLKTLEEPPPHVKFLLATTDPRKLPVTVLSRCLQFNLKRLDPSQIEAQFRKILDAENTAYDTASLTLLARAADGSLRDGLSLLDQAIAYGGGKVAEAEVRAMLGTIDQDAVDRALRALADNDAHALLAVVADVAEHGTGIESLLAALLAALHRIALTQVAPGLAGESDAERLREHAARLAPEDIQLYYQIGLMGQRDLPYAPDPRTGVEMVLLRMLAFRPVTTTAEPTVAAPGGANRVPARPAPAMSRAQPVETKPPVAAATKTSEPSAARIPLSPERWNEIVIGLGLAGLMRELASHTMLESESSGTLSIVLHESCAKLHNKEREAEFKRALETYYGRSFKLSLRIGQPAGETPAQEKARARNERQEAAERAIQSDPAVGTLLQKFGARVVPGTIRPTTPGTEEVESVGNQPPKAPENAIKLTFIAENSLTWRPNKPVFGGSKSIFILLGALRHCSERNNERRTRQYSETGAGDAGEPEARAARACCARNHRQRGWRYGAYYHDRPTRRQARGARSVATQRRQRGARRPDRGGNQRCRAQGRTSHTGKNGRHHRWARHPRHADAVLKK